MLSSPVAECGNPIVDASKNALSKIEIDILMLQSKRRDLEDKVSSLKAFNDNSTNDGKLLNILFHKLRNIKFYF